MPIDGDALVRFAQRLVRTPSVHEPERGRTEEHVARLVVEELRALGMHAVFDDVAPERPNVYGVVSGARPGPTLCLVAPLDVATEGDLGAWAFPPWSGDVERGLLCGRGAAAKGALAAAVHAVRAVAEESAFAGTVLVAALVDTEGRAAGARHFVASGQADGVGAVLCCVPTAGRVCTASAGLRSLHVRFRGGTGHASATSDAAVRAAAAFVSDLDAVEAELIAGAPRHELLAPPSLRTTTLHGGDAAHPHVVPARVDVAVDVRTVPGLDEATVVGTVRAAADRAAAAVHGVEVLVHLVEERPAASIAPDAPLAAAVAAAHELIVGGRATASGSPLPLPCTVLAADAGLAWVAYGAGDPGAAYRPDECVPVADVLVAADVYADALRRTLAA